MQALSAQALRPLAAAVSGLSGKRTAATRRPRLAAERALGCALACSANAFAATYTVDTLGDPGPGGTINLRQAIVDANANPGSTIQFAASLDGGTIALTHGELAIGVNLTIAGPGAARLSFSGNGASRIFNIADPGSAPPTVSISGLTLKNGLAAGSAPGGALFVHNANVTLPHAVVSGSSAGYGGGVYVKNEDSESFLADDVQVEGNTATAIGGGLYLVTHENSTISQSVISGNGAAACAGLGAFPIGTPGAAVTVNGTKISGNSATYGSGGGVCAYSLQLSNSTISGNSALGQGGGLVLTGVSNLDGARILYNIAHLGGGGLLANGSATTISLTACDISGNQGGADPSAYGGGIDVSGKKLTIDRSLISNNSTSGTIDGGGGIALGGTVETAIRNATIANNSSNYRGGGIVALTSVSADSLTLEHVTIAANHTLGSATGNGIDAPAGTPTLRNTVVAGNFASNNAQDLHGSFNADFSLIQNKGTATVTGTSNITDGGDPLLGALAVNGGPTRSMLPLVDSPLLDSGDPATPQGVEQRGLTRVANGIVDIGAVERHYPEDVVFRAGFDPD
jgi:hypothetical protein